MSAFGGKAENICSARVFRLLTQLRHSRCTAATVLMPISPPSKSRLSRYNAVSRAWGRTAGARVHYSDQRRKGGSHAKIHAYCRSWNVAFVKVIEGDLGSRT